MLCSPERSRSAVDGRAEGCSVRERSVALAWTRTLLECTSTSALVLAMGGGGGGDKRGGGADICACQLGLEYGEDRAKSSN